MFTTRLQYYYRLVKHSQPAHFVLLDINNLIEYQMQIQLLWDHDKMKKKKKQGHFVILSKHRQNQSHYTSHKIPLDRIAPAFRQHPMWSNSLLPWSLPQIIYPKPKSCNSSFLTYSYWDTPESFITCVLFLQRVEFQLVKLQVCSCLSLAEGQWHAILGNIFHSIYKYLRGIIKGIQTGMSSVLFHLIWRICWSCSFIHSKYIYWAFTL